MFGYLPCRYKQGLDDLRSTWDVKLHSEYLIWDFFV